MSLGVFTGLTMDGTSNTDDATVLANVRSAIRRQHPQVFPTGVNGDRIALVCGGPSLNHTFDELRKAVFEGAKLVTVNGSYQWCLERNLQPRAQIILDARPGNARFLTPEVEDCRYYICSQCAPEVWDAVDRYPYVGIWHNACDEAVKAELDDYYRGHWVGMAGGTTVGTRAISVMRTLGFLRYDIFGMDSCWLDDQHHAYPQAENQNDRRLRITVAPDDNPAIARSFFCAPWMLKQAEDFVAFLRDNSGKFLLNVHGDGLIAFMLTSLNADVRVEDA